MASHSWSYDAPSGTWKNRTISNKLLEAAYSETMFQPWCDVENAMGKGKGESVDIFTFTGPDEPSDATLTEGVRIPEDSIAISSVRLTVGEIGRGVSHTKLFEHLAAYDVNDFIQRRLRRTLALYLDTKAGQEFRTGKVAFIPTSISGGVFDTDGTPSTAAANNVTLRHLQLIRDELYGVYKAPYYDGATYIGVFAYTACRGIRDDPNWQKWYTQNSPEKLANGEIGTIEAIRIMETNHVSNDAGTLLGPLRSQLGTNSDMGEGVVFGAEAVAYGEAMTPEVMIKTGDTDYGRDRGAAWYGICGWQIKHDTANVGENRIVVVTSST